MGFRFQKRIKLMPGVTLNLSKSGVSTSLGVKGARVTYGHGQQRTTLGLPDSGISHTTVQRTRGSRAQKTPEVSGWVVLFAFFGVAMFLYALFRR